MSRLILIFICISCVLSACNIGSISDLAPIERPAGSGRYATGLTDDQRVSLARDRQKELRTIRKGDYLLSQNNAIEAIAAYLQVLERIPDDIVVRRKLAHAYFLTHDWKSTYQNYTLVPLSEMHEDEQKELF
jgi:Flp pilus assembly protein TadD